MENKDRKKSESPDSAQRQSSNDSSGAEEENTEPPASDVSVADDTTASSPNGAASNHKPSRAISSHSPNRAEASVSPSRVEAGVSPNRVEASVSPSRVEASVSPSRGAASQIPSRAAAGQSPSRAAASQSPSRAAASQSPGRGAANQSRSGHIGRDRHALAHNRGTSNHLGVSGCVNANHGSHSRNHHRDSHHHRERHRPASASQEPVAPEDVGLVEDEGAPLDGLAQADVVIVEHSAPSGLATGSAGLQSGGPPNQPLYYNWQATKSSLKDRLAFMFNNETMADVHFLVGKGGNIQRMPAHKFVLAVGSAVFDAMFNGGMATTSSEVELPDVEPAAFLALLKFLYSDEVHIGPETVMTTLYTAKKYAVPALEQACVDFLKRNLSSDNAFMLLTQARLFDEPQLAALCLETIDKNTSEALTAEGFTDIDLDTLCVVLERDTLGIRECKLFNSSCKWAEAECIRQNRTVTSDNRRAMLARGLHLIRFPLMTVEEFAMGAAQSAILSDREVVELFLHFTVNPKPSVCFQDTPRCCLTGKEQVVSRFCQIESRWGYSGTSDRIRSVLLARCIV